MSLAFLSTDTLAQTTLDHKTAGEKFKSVSVLADMPADQMGKVMNLMSASLGVNCGYCHEGTNFAKDLVGYKEEGRKMLSMTLELNKRFFDGKNEINCNTCHRGKAHPDSALSLDQVAIFKSTNRNSMEGSQDVTKPNADMIWSRYLDALGGKQSVEALKSRHVVAKRIEPNGKSEPEELWQTAPNRSRMTTQYGSVSVTEGYDGNIAWKSANDTQIELKSDEAEQIRTEAVLAFGSLAPSYYARLSYLRLERIQERDVHVLGMVNTARTPERLYFDAQNGLLVRRIASVPTFLGPFDYQVDYQDYKPFGGVLQPTLIRYAVPNVTWTRQVIAIETNVEIDESLFRKP